MANERERKNMYLDHFTTDFTHIIAAITSIYEIFLWGGVFAFALDLVLTQNSQISFGRSDRHGEERTGVHAFIRQRDITDADGQLWWCCTHKLDSVVP